MKKLFLPVIILILSFVSFAIAQKDLSITRDDKQSDGYVGVALLIGNSAYQNATVLNSPVNDAGDMAKTLGLLGFKVLKVRSNANLTEMEAAIAEFGNELAKNRGVGVFYYSGHGVQSKGQNYLIPVDAKIPNESFLKQKAVDLESVMGTMDDATDKAKIVILDACRNDPFKGWRSKGEAEKGLAKVDAPEGMLIAFATSPKKTAADGNGRNSPYTEILLQEIVKPNISINDMLQNVRTILAEKTNKSQISWENTSLLGKFYFAGLTDSVSPIPPTPQVGNNAIAEQSTLSHGNKSGKVLYVFSYISGLDRKLPSSDAFENLVITKLKALGLIVLKNSNIDLKESESNQLLGGLNMRNDSRALRALPTALIFHVTMDSLVDLPQYQGLYVSKVSGNVEIIDTENNKIVLVKSFQDIRGFGNSREQARENALKSAAQELDDSFLKSVKEKAK